MRISWPLSFILAACGPQILEPTTDAPSSDSTSTSADTTDAEPTSPSTGERICVGPGPDDIPTCDDWAGTRASWSLEPMVGPAQSLESHCTVTDILDDGQIETLTLHCPGLTRTLALETWTPHTPTSLQVGAEVLLQETGVPSPGLTWGTFVLRDPLTDQLLAGGIHAPLESVSLPPFAVALRRSGCDNPHGHCSVIQQGALEITADTDTVVLFDGNTAVLDDTRILVGTATREECYGTYPDCNPSYPLWAIEALFIHL
jgi:hypothetical protein